MDGSWGGTCAPERRRPLERSLLCLAYVGLRAGAALQALHEHGAQITDEEAGGVLGWPLAAAPGMARGLSAIKFLHSSPPLFGVLCSYLAEHRTSGGAYAAALRSMQGLVAPLLHVLTQAAAGLARPGY